MKKIIILPLVLAALTLCAKEESKLVWPSAPDEAKIEFKYTFSKPEDLKIEKGFFAKLWEFVAGEEKNFLVKPFGVHHDKKKIYVTDAGIGALYVFNLDKKDKLVIDGSKNERFKSPLDVDTDGKGNIYVSDSINAAVYVFDDEGNYIKKIGAKELKRPTGIAINRALGRLYVTDTVTSEIKIFSLDGKFIKSIGGFGKGDGEFNRPTFLAIGKNGNLYVSDTINSRIQILDKDGGFISKFGQLGKTVGNFANPRGIALDADENIYVTDTLFNVVQIFDKEGQLLLVMGGQGAGKGQFYIPEDVDISNDGTIFVADSLNMRVQVFQLLSKSSK